MREKNKIANICRSLRKKFFFSSPQVTYPYRIYWCKKMGRKSHTWAPLRYNKFDLFRVRWESSAKKITGKKLGSWELLSTTIKKWKTSKSVHFYVNTIFYKNFLQLFSAESKTASNSVYFNTVRISPDTSYFFGITATSNNCKYETWRNYLFG